MRITQVNNRSLFNLLGAPGVCVLCAGITGPEALCDGCLADLRPAHPACPRCGLFLPGAAPETLCGECLRNPPPQFRTLTGSEYAWPVDRLILRFKDQGRLESGRALLPPLLSAIAHARERPDLLTEIPASRAGLRQRGFQQARLLAAWIAKSVGVPHRAGILKRAAGARPQRRLSGPARRSNLRDRLRTAHTFQGEHVAVVDDVITTGSTVAEASRVLLEAGAGRVSVWGLARAPRGKEIQDRFS